MVSGPLSTLDGMFFLFRMQYSVAGPTAWNGLPVALRLMPVARSVLFLSGLKTTLFDRGWAGSAPE